ncbi:3-isopropylmalate/(R)-2-methylmalate dehydratase small subunit [Acidovorax delafieldii]|uniref:3-isopropylmalate dehydratase n=1 Tax=Acidovorax delafieldii TaxID=47920 RepID=A0AAJ2BTQ2_ACIDE|nr:3-isopropylmalate dehydratase small subunit [Acidovorax delafieldii]MDR6767811.1 3-isopropylmalate/(R)-2-methylmalate dehydratase small subunit [Acidovorax delafieldii]MDR6839146.1 3-isopropylmalate/(R)-2-methylmalate dehydratase small subunit [Acidovorax delafieldii]MDR7368306.1 3-isopropylmalate/(R)-2-methylmalate dehydratase small subunit [Acidovorax delafieldii]
MSADHNTSLRGRAALLDIANLDTDQIMPKQFLRGIDKSGLAPGLLYDLRFDGAGQPREDFVLNQPAFAGTDVLLAGSNYGCGSSREHAVWGMQQYGFKAVVASSFGEIFYSNAMNNRLLLAMVSEDDAQAFMREARAHQGPMAIEIDVEQRQVRAAGHSASFTISERHRRMFIDGLDVIGASLTYRDEITAFAQRHWAAQPWVKDVARRTRDRLSAASA